jgi:hypothetical protein
MLCDCSGRVFVRRHIAGPFQPSRMAGCHHALVGGAAVGIILNVLNELQTARSGGYVDPAIK